MDLKCGHFMIPDAPGIIKSLINIIDISISIIFCSLFELSRAEGVMGKDVTPFILQKVSALTQGKSLQASILLKV